MGAVFTAVCLITGSLWGKPMWGAWWVWDARLTSVLVLFFLYLGQIALIRAFDNQERGFRAAAILALVGAVNLPIIKFSVDWWNTLHQPDTIHLFGQTTMPASMLDPLLVCALGFTLLFAAVVLARLRAAVMERRIRASAHGPRAARRWSERMTNLPFIAGSYGVAILAALALSVNAWLRHGQARRRLAGLEAESPRRPRRTSGVRTP